MAKQNLDELLEQAEEKIEKGEGLDEIEAEHHGKEKLKVKDQKSKIGEKIKSVKMEKEEKGVEEVEGVKEKGEIEEKTIKAKPAETKGEGEKPAKKKEKRGKAKIRSKKYQEAKSLMDTNKKYDIEEAIELVKKTSMTKFDGNVEVHIRMLSKSGKPEQIRGPIQYPHAAYKTEYKTDSLGNIHQIIGKVSVDIKTLIENYNALISLLPSEKIASITLCATMGPGIKVQK